MSKNFLRTFVLYYNSTNDFCIPVISSCKVRTTKEKGGNELQVIKENLGGSKTLTTPSSVHPGVGVRNGRYIAEEIARYARAYLFFVHFSAVHVISKTWNYFFCSSVDNLRTWRKSINFLPKLFIGVRFVTQTTRNNLEIIAETWSYIYRWRPRSRGGPPCFSSLVYAQQYLHT